jgi:hypothetical protein
MVDKIHKSHILAQDQNGALNMPIYPWEFAPGLKIERLQRVATILRETRASTVGSYDPKLGDGPWSLGCLVYERSMNRLVEASATLGWLAVLSDSLEFVFSIDGIPVRFYRGDGDNPTPKQLSCCHTELRQLSLINQSTSNDLAWRIAVETDAVGLATGIVIIGFALENVAARDQSIQCYYEIPESIGNVALFPDRRPPRGGGIDLPEPVAIVRPKEKGEETKTDDYDE